MKPGTGILFHSIANGNVLVRDTAPNSGLKGRAPPSGTAERLLGIGTSDLITSPNPDVVRFVHGDGFAYVDGGKSSIRASLTSASMAAASLASVMTRKSGWRAVGGDCGEGVDGRIAVVDGEGPYPDGLKKVPAPDNVPDNAFSCWQPYRSKPRRQK